MTRHILRVDAAGTHAVIPTLDSCESRAVCAALQDAADLFMRPVIRERGIRRLLAVVRNFVRHPNTEGPVGWFWIELGRDGNLDIGSRLTPSELISAIPDRIRERIKP